MLPGIRQLLIIAACALPVAANSTGPIGGLTGAPNHQTCAICHGTGDVNSGGGRIRVEAINASTYTPGQTLRLRITIEDSAASRWGFQLTARRASANTQTLGGFSLVAGQGTTIPAPSNPVLVQHNSSGTRPGITGSTSWEVDWNPPAANEGAVIFYAAGNAANNNSQADSGDRVYTTSVQIEPAGTGMPTGNAALPQFVFGGGYSSELNFSNIGNDAAMVQVTFLNDSGGPLTVNGSSEATLSVPGKGTATIRAADVGPLTQGWALVDLPDGVSAGGVFQQVVAGRPDQEAAVLLVKANSTEARFSYDQTGPYNTGVVIVNTSGAAADVTLRFRDESGAEVASGTRNVGARSKIAISVRNDAALSGALGRRGLAEIQVSGSTVAVLALRFNDSGALTSIPIF